MHTAIYKLLYMAVCMGEIATCLTNTNIQQLFKPHRSN